MRRYLILTFVVILIFPLAQVYAEPTLLGAEMRSYPWKKDIVTTEFWIGEPGAGKTTAWGDNWPSSNHALAMNPFFVALPFNDLAFPDKARRWLPEGWARKPKDGKKVSACKDRWLEIKNSDGDICYAQWEDSGPRRHDHAEYVFGDERPGPGNYAGLDVSPAVAKYLRLDPEGKNRLTSWRFVDAQDVPTGVWLKYHETDFLYSAMHQKTK
jgi:hypothetical protein